METKLMDHYLLLRRTKTNDLWMEIGRRLKVKYGRVHMAFHAGKPSRFAEIELRVDLEQPDSENSEPQSS